MRVGFYAPMKPLDHPVASGDRTMGRLLRAALEAAGHEVEVVSTLRSFLRAPDAGAQAAVAEAARSEVERVEARWREPGAAPDLWFTYHNHHKAPDLLGPDLSRAAAIPYVIAEASHAARQADTWRSWHEAATHATAAADLHLSFTERDRLGLEPVRGARSRMVDLPPFIDTRGWPTPPPRPATVRPCRLVTVAMMRDGDKLRSYQHLAAALATVDPASWTLDVVGDGPARLAVEAAFAPLLRAAIRWRGALPADGVRDAIAEADLYVWPGFAEAYGLGYLEAQAMGMPVVALRTAGVPSVVRHGVTGLLVDGFEPPVFGKAIEALVQDGDTRLRFGAAAVPFVRDERGFLEASRILARALDSLVPVQA